MSKYVLFLNNYTVILSYNCNVVKNSFQQCARIVDVLFQVIFARFDATVYFWRDFPRWRKAIFKNRNLVGRWLPVTSSGTVFADWFLLCQYISAFGPTSTLVPWRVTLDLLRRSSRAFLFAVPLLDVCKYLRLKPVFQQKQISKFGVIKFAWMFLKVGVSVMGLYYIWSETELIVLRVRRGASLGNSRSGRRGTARTTPDIWRVWDHPPFGHRPVNNIIS